MQHAVIWRGACCYLMWDVLLSDVGRAVTWCGGMLLSDMGRAVIWCGACCYQLGGVLSQLWNMLHENAVMSSNGTTNLLPAVQSTMMQLKCTERKRLFIKHYTPNMSLGCTIQNKPVDEKKLKEVHHTRGSEWWKSACWGFNGHICWNIHLIKTCWPHTISQTGKLT